MKLTLWQQFASNHSNSFTLVGVFPSPDEARLAADTLRDFLSRYMAWAAANPDDASFHIRQPNAGDLPEPEAGFYAQEGITVRRSILEWIFALNHYVRLDDTLFAYEHVLLMDSQTDAAQGGRPFDELIIRWGGTPYVYAETGETALYYQLEIDAPDETVAVEIEDSLRRKYAPDADPAPWVRFDSGIEITPDAMAGMQALVQKYQLWRAKGEEIRKTSLRALRERRIAQHEALNPLANVPDAEHRRIERMTALSSMVWWSRSSDSAIRRTGKHLALDIWHFAGIAHLRGLPALITWLRSLGCDVNYSFEVRG